MNNKPTKVCAIYTRKSSEEGLEQEFNSLQAQRESCEAYILSHRHEGWLLHPDNYDDGGISGGTMHRPALLRLLQDIKDGTVDIIVVYKVDRLTRSLADFAKMVDIFDEHSASFVSVTQQFNTTDSMGRLTLNVLLSFAQFEREVTGERIRDKIAASKKKGMWMGGKPPIGYDCIDKQLVINNAGAEKVRLIFNLYLKVKSVAVLMDELNKRNCVTPIRQSQSGKTYGGKPFSRGHLYRILSNAIYIGKIVHKGNINDGLHKPIIEAYIWEQTQASLNLNIRGRNKGQESRPSKHLLTGLLFDDTGQRLTPIHSNKKGITYRYYISTELINGNPDDEFKRTAWRLPAEDLEQAVIKYLAYLFNNTDLLINKLCLGKLSSNTIKYCVENCHLIADKITNKNDAQHPTFHNIVERISISSKAISLALNTEELFSNSIDMIRSENKHYPDSITVEFEVSFKKRGVETKLIYNQDNTGNPDPALIKVIVRGHQWFNELVAGEVDSINAIGRRDNLCPTLVSRHIHISRLSPNILEMCLKGTQPVGLTAQWLNKNAYKLPIYWTNQEYMIRNLDA